MAKGNWSKYKPRMRCFFCGKAMGNVVARYGHHPCHPSCLAERNESRLKIGDIVLVTGGARAGSSGVYAGTEETLVGKLHRVELDDGNATLVSAQQIVQADLLQSQDSWYRGKDAR